MDFGKRLKESRKKTGLSQEELAYEINQRINGTIKRNTISNYENNVSRPDFDTLYALAEILSTSIDDLFNLSTKYFKSILEDKKELYASSKVLKEADKKMTHIEASRKTAKSKGAVTGLLQDSIELNKYLMEQYQKLHTKNRQAIEFINQGLDME
ncbi:MAG: helix-turn-helix transcriptional regulator [Bacteroidota bacterium]